MAMDSSGVEAGPGDGRLQFECWFLFLLSVGFLHESFKQMRSTFSLCKVETITPITASLYW